jgi:nicotinamide-nucleotide amidase
VTGIAGPDGGTPEKPVGTVFIAWADNNGAAKVIKEQFSGDRRQIREQTVKSAVEGICLFC